MTPRGHVKFVALFDLDEVLYARPPATAAQTLELLALRHPGAATFKLHWNMTMHDVRILKFRQEI